MLPIATLGIAASNMPTSRTTHSIFKIPNDYGQYLSCNVGKQSHDLLRRDLCLPDVPFSGKIIVLGGDFHQIVLVVPKKHIKKLLNTA